MSPFTDAAPLAGWFSAETGLRKSGRAQKHDNALLNITLK